MKQDIVSNALNEIMNAKRAGKSEVEIKHISKVLKELLELMKNYGLVEFKIEDGKKPVVKVELLKLNKCKSIKPRYYVSVSEIEKYLRRYLPSRNFGVLIISTNKGMMTHQEAEQNKLGGALIAYFY